MNKQLHVKTRKKILFPHNKVTCKVREEQDKMGIFNIPNAYINLEAIKVMFTASLSGLKTPTFGKTGFLSLYSRPYHHCYMYI